MADVKKIATRESYGNTLKELAAEGHEDLVVLDADLAAATKTGMFRKAYPDRHFDCGIAEENMMGVAAGLSTMGYVPFVSSFAMFAAGRAFEQVRNSIGYPHLNVKIGATHGGISVGEDGASHQCCEDFALMRSIPGMTVICPADDVEARAAVRAAYAMEGPVYLRFGRLAVPVFHDAENYHFEIGKGEQITEGSDIAIIATGLMVNEARIAAEQLAAEGIHARVINIHTIKPLDEEIVLKAAKECGKVITAEEHNVIGGLGEAVCAVLSEKLPTPVRRVGVQDVFGCSGPAWDLLKFYGLDAATICKTAHECWANKAVRNIIRAEGLLHVRSKRGAAAPFCVHSSPSSFARLAYTAVNTSRSRWISGRGSSRRVSRQVSGNGSCSGRYHAAGKAGYFIGHKNMPRPASRSL